MSSILDELKYKYPNTEGVLKANNIAEGVAAMPTGGSGGGSESLFFVGGVTFGENEALEGTLDKTWQEIHDAMQNKICIVVIPTDEGFVQDFVSAAIMINGTYLVIIDANQFSTSTASGYPRVTK